MAESGGGSGIVLLAGAGIAAYYFWPRVSAALGIGQPAPPPQSSIPSTLPPGTPPGIQTTNYSPSINTPGAVPLGTQGCFSYAGTISCPPGVSPPPPAPIAQNCQPGYSVDASGACTQYTDAQLVAGLNSLQWSGTANIPAEQIARIDPQILAQYSNTYGVTPGSVLAYMLGLGGSAANETQATGSDGNLYIMTSGQWIRQPTAALHGMRGARLGAIALGLPVTNDTLERASWDATTAAILGSDPRGLLTVGQWNYFYTQASGVLQTRPTHPFGQQGAKINAQQYQALRTQAGLPVRLGSIRNARPGAFPSGLGPLQALGSIRSGASRTPFVHPGNRNIYRIPGRGAVAQRIGTIQSGGGDHRWGRSPFPRPADWRQAE